MKKSLSLLLALLLIAGLMAGCAGNDAPGDVEPPAEAGGDGAAEVVGTITVGASPTPHADILEAARPELLALGYELEIVEFSDYVLPNEALNNGELDANYFQHEPYLTDYNEENGNELVAASYIHYEPLGLYPGKVPSVDDLAEGDQIAVPNDSSNGGRALKLLETLELITLDPEAGLFASALDIVENPLSLDIIEVEAAQIPRYLDDVAMGVINGNFAMGAGLNAEADALAKEERESVAASTYANIIAVQPGDEDREDIQSLIQALQSETVQAFIQEQYQGSVVTVF